MIARSVRSPVLTAMMVCSLVFGVAALAAGIKVWRVSSACTIAQTSTPQNVAQVVTEVADGTDPFADAALARKVASAACPCAVSRGWHWQRI